MPFSQMQPVAEMLLRSAGWVAVASSAGSLWLDPVGPPVRWLATMEAAAEQEARDRVPIDDIPADGG